MRIFKEILPMTAELFRADRQTDRHREAISVFRSRVHYRVHKSPSFAHILIQSTLATLSQPISLRLILVTSCHFALPKFCLHYLLHTRPISRRVFDKSCRSFSKKNRSVDSSVNVVTRLQDGRLCV